MVGKDRGATQGRGTPGPGGRDRGAEGSGAQGRGALRRSEERFRLLVESVVDYAIFMLDPHGIVESWNSGAERLKGYREEEILGRHYSTFYTPETREAGLPDRLLAEARDRGVAKNTGWRVRKDGTRFWADVVITALYDETGKHTGFAKVTRDMTESHLANEAREHALEEQRRAVARLEELDEWRREFIGSVVHDLQAPITAITGFTDLLLDPDGESEEAHREFLEHVESNTRSLQEMVDNLRAHARLAERRVDLTRHRFDLRAFVARLIADMAPLFASRSVTTDIEDVEASADPKALERILRNLLSNAARHTPPGTAIRIGARTVGDDVLFEVEDDGGGIPAEQLPLVFERFERGDAGGGAGLGLAIAKQYVELHGGSISAHSTVGDGTTVRFTIPPEPAQSGA